MTKSASDPAVPAFRFSSLTKRFGDFTAVDQVSLDIPTGSFFGLVGPDGAGKTTLLSLAVGLIRPQYGTSFVHGADVLERHRCGEDSAGRSAGGGILAAEADRL